MGDGELESGEGSKKSKRTEKETARSGETGRRKRDLAVAQIEQMSNQESPNGHFLGLQYLFHPTERDADWPYSIPVMTSSDIKKS